MDYSGYWQAASTDGASDQNHWSPAAPQDEWSTWQQQQAREQWQQAQEGDQGPPPGAWPAEQAAPPAGEYQSFSNTSAHLSGDSAPEPPPLPPGNASSEELESASEAPPPLPEGPPPLPFDQPPPLPTEDYGSHAASQLPHEPAGVAVPQGLSNPDPILDQPMPLSSSQQAGQQPLRASEPGASPPGETAQSQGISEETQGGWSANYYHHTPASQTQYQAAQAGYQQAAPAMPPDPYAVGHGHCHSPWQTPTYSYAEQQQQLQYQAYYQQQQAQQAWQPLQAAPWHAAAAMASQYSAAAPYAAQSGYLLAETAPQASHVHPAHQARAATPPGPNNLYPAAGTYQADALPALPAGASMTGLSGPPQTPIVIVQATDLFELPACAKRPKKVLLWRGPCPVLARGHTCEHGPQANGPVLQGHCGCLEPRQEYIFLAQRHKHQNSFRQ